MEERLANLNLLDEEEDAFHKKATVVDQNYQFCLVGRCLTDSIVHFPSLCNTMANLWHPIGGICILDLGDKRFLFQFFHDVDVQRVLFGTPMFLEYDTSILTMEIKKFIRIRVFLDVSLPLKRKKKILIRKERTVCARFHKWLREVDGSKCSRVDMERDNKNKNSGKEHDVGRTDSWRNMGSRDLNGVVSAGEPMDLVLTEENNPLIFLEGKKRQRIVVVSTTSSGNNIEGGSFDFTASSVGQSS
ncbi:hypothetical protein Gogos_008504 [Gossypium gossypioides]|uniref:DUF4283 domain-containing protein n=1 Tax=Gossypium gossypioides TaxID=34282 RepID=A0A7J9CBV2_GOSGO|nr:hypothetical protein [Gossypium gossypioides]